MISIGHEDLNIPGRKLEFRWLRQNVDGDLHKNIWGNKNIFEIPTWRDVGAVACAGHHYVGLVRGVEGFTRTEKAV